MAKLIRPFSLPLMLFVLLLLSACQAVIYEKGTILDPQAVAQITVGTTTRAQVKELLGVPTFISHIRKDRWSYVQDRQFKNMQRTFSRVSNRVEVTFDERGIVKEIQTNFDKELLDPTKLSTARNQQSWFQWLWGGEYMYPATDGQHAAQDAAKVSSTPQEELASGRSRKPWWQFWSR